MISPNSFLFVAVGFPKLDAIAKTQQVINEFCSKCGQAHTTSRSFLLRQSAVLSLVKSKGNGNGERLGMCLMVWKTASDWSKSLFSSTTHDRKRMLWKVEWAAHIMLITCCVLKALSCALRFCTQSNQRAISMPCDFEIQFAVFYRHKTL